MLITYLDKDKDIPDTEIRGQWRALDANEVKTVVNANQQALAAVIQVAVDTAVAAVLSGAPGALNTLLELAAALGNDPNFAATVTNALALKAPLASPTFSGTPSLPTGTIGVTQVNGDNSTKLSTTAYADAKVAQTINNGILTSAPSQNEVFDALATKQDTLVSGTTIKQVQGVSILGSGNINLIDDAIVDGEAKAPSQNAVYDALALKATIQYVDDVVASLGINFKAVPAAVATTANITLSGEQTINGVLTSASKVLVKDQTSQSQNGLYISAAGAWSRSTDADTGAELEGAAINVTGGSQAGNWWQITKNITLGGSSIIWIPIGSNAPDATALIKGIMRLYIGTGSNTDGTMDQNSITQALALKSPLISPAFTTPNLGTPSAATLTNATGLPIAGISGLASGIAALLAAATSANLAAAISDETGTGALVFATSPTMVTPALGTPTVIILTNATGLPLTTGVTGTLPVANGGNGTTTGISNAVQNALNAKTTNTNFAVGVTPTGAINGDIDGNGNKVFDIGQAIVNGSSEWFLGPGRLTEGIDYTIVGSVATFVFAPETGSTIRVNFIRP